MEGVHKLLCARIVKWKEAYKEGTGQSEQRFLNLESSILAFLLFISNVSANRLTQESV